MKAGMLCSGIMIVVFFEILRAVFCALFFTTKLPNPRKYTFSSLDKESFTASMKATTDRGYTLANGTQIPERTEWHNIVASNRLAEIVDKYVHKGDKLYLEGKIRTRSYSDQSGAMRYITEIFVDNMEMLSPKGANTGAGAPQPSATQAQQPQQMQQPQQQAQPSQAQPIQDNPADDLPF